MNTPATSAASSSPPSASSVFSRRPRRPARTARRAPDAALARRRLAALLPRPRRPRLMQAFQLVEWQQPPVLRDVPVPGAGPGRGAGQGRRGGCLPLRPAPDGVAGGHAALRAPVHARPRERRLDRGARAGREGLGGRRSRRGLRAVGLRTLPPVPDRAGDTVRARGASSAPPAAASAATAAWPSTCSSRDPRLLVPLGDLDPRDAAPLSDAALTPYHAIKLALHQLVPGTSAVVIGVGGLGHMAVQILRALTPARVIATDVDAAKLALAVERRRRSRRSAPARTPRPRSASSPAGAAPRSCSTAWAATPRSRSTRRWSPRAAP